MLLLLLLLDCLPLQVKVCHSSLSCMDALPPIHLLLLLLLHPQVKVNEFKPASLSLTSMLLLLLLLLLLYHEPTGQGV
jgi:hypothetical protein